MKNLVNLLLTISLLLILTTITIVYSRGYRIKESDPENETNNVYQISKTGILAIRSIPDGAKVYLEDDIEPITATNDTITSLKPGIYKIRVEKEGFESWTKNLEVYSELVTDITAVLVLKSPRLEPLTNYDVEQFSISNDTNILAYTTRSNPKPGIWILNLNYSPINVFKSNSTLLVEDNSLYSPSLADQITWSKDDQNLIAQLNNQAYLVYSSSNNIIGANNTPTIKNASSINKLLSEVDQKWSENFIMKKEAIINKQESPDYIVNQLSSSNNVWSPDYYKFFYLKEDQNSDKNIITIYNSEEPLPVGEKRIYDSIYINKNAKVYWYSDSYHLILVEPEAANVYRISLIRIDGTNKTNIYNGLLASDQAYSTPAGDKVIVLTNLKEGSYKNLYTIAIR